MGWTEEDGEIFRALWGDGPGTESCVVKGLSILVANKSDLSESSHQGEQGQHMNPRGGIAAVAAAHQWQQEQREQQHMSILLPLVCRKTFLRTVGTSAINRLGLEELGAVGV